MSSRSTDDVESSTTSEFTLIAEKHETLRSDPSSEWSLESVGMVLIWIVLSICVILFNKYIMENLNFRFRTCLSARHGATLTALAITLTCWHLVFAACITQLLARTTRCVDGRKKVKMTGSIYLRAVLPIAIMYSGSLICSNLPYMSLSVAFIQMLKGMDLAIVLLAMWALGLTSPTAHVWLNLFVIIIGVTMTVFGEIKFVLSGFLFQVAGRVFESIRLALIQQILSGDEQKMDPLVSLYYFSPVCSVIIGFVFVFTELPRLRVHDIQHTGVGFLMANAAVAFLLNVAGVVLIGKTSALMLPLSGVLKTIFLIFASAMLWGTVVTPIQLIGCFIATIGLLNYSFGREKLHIFPFLCIGQNRRGAKGTTRRRFARCKFAIVFIFLASSGGAVGGWYAGYNVEWDPRVSWYSAKQSWNATVGILKTES